MILVFMDAPAIREELRDMARRLATAGYYVMLPNLYYRAGVLELVPPGRAMDDALRARMMELMDGLSIAMVMERTDACWPSPGLRPRQCGQGRVRGVALHGGQFSINAAARAGRVKAAASITAPSWSPTRTTRTWRRARPAASFYFGCAEIDRWAPAETVEALAASLKADGIKAEVEVYPGVNTASCSPAEGALRQGRSRRFGRGWANCSGGIWGRAARVVVSAPPAPPGRLRGSSRDGSR